MHTYFFISIFSKLSSPRQAPNAHDNNENHFPPKEKKINLAIVFERYLLGVIIIISRLLKPITAKIINYPIWVRVVHADGIDQLECQVLGKNEALRKYCGMLCSPRKWCSFLWSPRQPYSGIGIICAAVRERWLRACGCVYLESRRMHTTGRKERKTKGDNYSIIFEWIHG